MRPDSGNRTVQFFKFAFADDGNALFFQQFRRHAVAGGQTAARMPAPVTQRLAFPVWLEQLHD